MTVEKRYQGRWAKTWVAITAQGAEVLRIEVAALNDIVARVEKTNRTGKVVRPHGLRVVPEPAS